MAGGGKGGAEAEAEPSSGVLAVVAAEAVEADDAGAQGGGGQTVAAAEGDGASVGTLADGGAGGTAADEAATEFSGALIGGSPSQATSDEPRAGPAKRNASPKSRFMFISQ